MPIYGYDANGNMAFDTGRDNFDQIIKSYSNEKTISTHIL